MCRHRAVPVLSLIASLLFSVAAEAFAFGASSAAAADSTWSSTFDYPGPDADITQMIEFDGALYVAGDFTSISGADVRNLARWNGTEWDGVGWNPVLKVTAMTVWNDDLIVAAASSPIYPSLLRYDGAGWTAVSTVPGVISAMTVYHGQLVCGFDGIRGGVLSFDGTRWTTLSLQNVFPAPSWLAVWGDRLIADFPAGRSDVLMKWNGIRWDYLAHYVADRVSAPLVTPEGLLIGGSIRSIEGTRATNLALWTESEWVSLGDRDEKVAAMTYYRGRPYVLSNRSRGFSLSVLAESGDALEPLATIYTGAISNRCIAVWNDRLCFGGDFGIAADMPSNRLASFDGEHLTTLGAQAGEGITGTPFDAVALPTGVLVGGDFQAVGTRPARNIALWNGTSWTTFGHGLPTVTLVGSDHGRPIAVTYDREERANAREVFRWDGDDWTDVALNLLSSSNVSHCELLDGEPVLLGRLRVARIDGPVLAARLNGEVLELLAPPPTETASALGVVDDELYAVDYTGDGAHKMSQIYRWEGDSWSAFLPPASGEVTGLVRWEGQWFASWGVTPFPFEPDIGGVVALRDDSWTEILTTEGIPSGAILPRVLQVIGNELVLPHRGGISWSGSHWSSWHGEVQGGDVRRWVTWRDGIYVVGGFISCGYVPSFGIGKFTVPLPPDFGSPDRLLAWPNPFRFETSLVLALDSRDATKLEIFDVAGALVRRWSSIDRATQVRWDGKNDLGAQVPSGCYWARVTLPERTRSTRIICIR